VGVRTISEVAFDLWANEEGLLDRLGLVSPEVHEPGAQCWRYTGTKLDLQKREVVHTFSRGVGMREWAFRPWEGGRPDFEPVLEITIQTLRIKATEAWRSASVLLAEAVSDGRAVIEGRVRSPLNEPQSIPASAWSFIEINDWSAQTGQGEGIGELYDLCEAVPNRDEPTEAKVGRLLALVRAELAEMHPNGVPNHLTDAQLYWDVSQRFEAKGIQRKPSLDTVKRAADRRKQK